jgi:predicted PurR-regulated permease PerM
VILGIHVLLIAAVALVGYVVAPSLVKEVQQLSHNAPRYAAEMRHNATFRHYDDRYHISTKLVHDARELPRLLGHQVGPLKDGVPYALSLGFVVGFFDLIPLVGATLDAIVVPFATLTASFPTATIVWVYRTCDRPSPTAPA